MMRWLFCLLAWALPAMASAEEVVLGLSHNQVAITATFDGSSLLLFGAVKRDAPLPSNSELDVVITVTGPSMPIDIRRKERRMGIWVNADSVRVLSAPSFYAVASTRPLSQIATPEVDRDNIISIDNLMRTVGPTRPAPDLADFTDALVRIRTEAELYQVQETGVTLDEQTLFRTSLDMPVNVVEGIYSTRIFLLREGEVIDRYFTTIEVRKVGLERWLYNLAYEKPLAYGIMSLVIAIAAGWLASAAFRMFQR